MMKTWTKGNANATTTPFALVDGREKFYSSREQRDKNMTTAAVAFDLDRQTGCWIEVL